MFVRYCLVVLATVWVIGLMTMPSGDFWISTIVILVVFASFADEANINITLPISVILSKTQLAKAASLAFYAGLVGPLCALSLQRKCKRFDRAVIDKNLGFPLVYLLIEYKKGNINNLFTCAYNMGRAYREGAV